MQLLSATLEEVEADYLEDEDDDDDDFPDEDVESEDDEENEDEDDEDEDEDEDDESFETASLSPLNYLQIGDYSEFAVLDRGHASQMVN